MKKLLSTLLITVLMATIFAGCGNKKELNLYTWAGMFPQEILDDFEKETGIQINYTNFDSDETMLQKLQAANGGDYDLIIADDYIIKTVIETENLAQKLDKSKLTNFNNINPAYQSQFFDPTNEYTVPYGSGVQTIVYDSSKIDFEINGYKDLWNPKLENRLGIVGNPRVINGMALKVLGYSYNTENVDEIKAAGQSLLTLAPNIRLIKDDSIQEDLLTGEIDVAIMYTSQVTAAKIQNPELTVVFPEEGIGFGIMANFIPVNAPNPDYAHQFIDYILRPEVAAKSFEFLGYYSTNMGADPLLNPSMKEFITLPDSLLTNNMEILEPVNEEAEAAHMQAWTEFKTATD